MLCKTILVVLGSTNSTSDLGCAIEMANEIDAHLSIIVAGLAPPPQVDEFSIGFGWADAREQDLKQFETIQNHATAACKANGLPFDVDVVYAEPTFVEAEIHRRTLYTDVLVIGDGVRSDVDLTRLIVEGGVFGAHVPLLLMPTARKATLKPKRMIVAWNSRPEAARAVREALDMMKVAETVHIEIIDPDNSYRVNGGEPGADIACYLARHGVNVVVEQLASGGRNVEDVLAQHALEINADLIVMGAYGHSRLRERIFGGVTAAMLRKSSFPILLAR